MNTRLGCTKRSPPPRTRRFISCALVFLRVLQNILKPVVWQIKLSLTLCSSTHSTFEAVNNTRLRSSTQHMLLPRFRMTAGGLLAVSETKGRLPSLCIHCLIYSCYRWIRCAAGDTCVSARAQPALRAHGGRQTQDNRLESRSRGSGDGRKIESVKRHGRREPRRDIFPHHFRRLDEIMFSCIKG